MDEGGPNDADDIEYSLTDIDRYVFVATVYDDKSVREITDELDRPNRPRDPDRATSVEPHLGLDDRDLTPREPMSTLELVRGARGLLEREYGVIEEHEGRYRPTADAPVDPEAVDEPAGPEAPVDVEEALEDPSAAARTVHTLLENEGALTAQEIERLSLGEREEATGNLRIGRQELERSDAVKVTGVEREAGRMRGYRLREERKWAKTQEDSEEGRDETSGKEV